MRVIIHFEKAKNQDVQKSGLPVALYGYETSSR
jgi:hypothetical protein